MPRRKRLPQCIRLHSRGRYRAEVRVDGKKLVGPLRDTPEEAVVDRDSIVRSRRVDVDHLWTLQRGLDEVYRDLDAGGARPATVAYYRNHARILFEWFDKDAPLHLLTADDIRAYVEKRLTADIALQTIWGKELQVLERIANLAVRRGVLSASPFRDVRRPKLRANRRDEMPVERLADLLVQIRQDASAHKAERDADIIALAFLTGLRRAEMARLRVADVNLDTGHLFVEGKNANRYLPIVGELEAVLRRLLAQAEGEVLVGSERLIEKVFARWKSRLGDPRIVPRSMRHGFATDHAANGTSPFELQVFMGHSNLRQTQRYFHSQAEQSRAAMRSVGERLAGRSPAAGPSGADPSADPPTTS